MRITVPSSGGAAHRIAGAIPMAVWSRNTTSPGYDSPDGRTSTMTRSPTFGPNISHSLEAHPAVGCVGVCDARRAGARVQSADRRGGTTGDEVPPRETCPLRMVARHRRVVANSGLFSERTRFNEKPHSPASELT